MAECSIATLLDDSCTNAFSKVAQNPIQARSYILQLLYDQSGGSETLSEIYAQACANGFVGVADNPVQRRSLMLQLLCNLGGD